MTMKIIKTSQLTGPALDWAVAKCEGMAPHAFVERDHGQGAHRPLECWCAIHVTPGGHTRYEPSTDWAQGGPIIDRELITVRPVYRAERLESGADHYRQDGWAAHVEPKAFWVTPRPYAGLTPLIAAMRCYVASKLGDEVDVPEELLAGSAA